MLPGWFIKVAFHLLYNQLAFTYDTVAWLVSFGQWAAWRRLSLLFLQPGPILELACGTGDLFDELQQAGYQPVGIDRSPYMMRLTAARLQQSGGDLEINQAKAQQLPFPDDFFTNIIATFPTTYIFEEQTLAEISRVLQPHGRLIVVMEGFLRGPQPLRGFIDWLYSITHQRGFHTLKPLTAFEAYHLDARWQIVESNDVSARILLAHKQPCP